ncbi:methylmalonyl-CoA mutase subunit beta [Formosa algae]|uniref:methylmalonyl-CoA mutase subunit beta n=1 Tax=Formosa algae TaxID=225843 RepID=UPI000CCDE4CF|nr:methylmalonyl-CoA mutase subunit beta [Formosa algae]PNW29735.1 hypothetical protein BKP44_03305 [Formosa algae]
MNNSNLFEAFTPVSAKAWKQKIQYDLNGADYNKTLISLTQEDINIKPFYNTDDFKTAALNFKSSSIPFSITQTIYVNSEEKSNTLALQALQDHAEAIAFTIPTFHCDLNQLLINIDLQLVTIYFDLQFSDSDFIQKLNTIAQDKQAVFYVGFDIIGHLTTDGNWYTSLQSDFKTLESVLKNSTHLKSSVSVNLANYQNAGATITQQLAYGLAHANEYLQSEAQLFNTQITFKTAIGGNYFFEIAKLRALRQLWFTLAQEYQANSHCHIRATPSRRNKTIYSSQTNTLRTQTECMSAILGGADSVCNLAHNALFRKNHISGEHTARHQLHILKAEQAFGKATNPADGAYYIESVTQQLADKALTLFKEIEAQGGFLKLLKAGVIQKKIKESATKEQEQFNSGALRLIGVNSHIDTKEKLKDKLELYPFVKQNPRKTLLEPIIPKRLAEPLEQDRLTSEH